MLQHISWDKLTITGRLVASRVENSPVTAWFLIKCFLLMALDICLYFGATISSYRILAWTLFTPAERGFYCDDPNIREEFHPNSVPTLILLAITLALPFFIIIFADFLARLTKPSKELERLFNHATYVYLDYIVGFWLSTLIIDIIKCYVGRKRPNFLAMCAPKELADVCHADPYAYVPVAHCTSSWKYNRNAKLSFPSGHATISVFATLFMFFYLRGVQRRHPHPCVKVLFVAVSTLFMLFTIYCCLSRITDSWHFPTDVLGGAALGFVLFHFLLHKYYKAFPNK